MTSSIKSKENLPLKTALVVGASGLVGHHLLSQLLSNEHYQKVIVIARNILAIETSTYSQKMLKKLQLITVDFEQLSLTDIYADHIFCALGTTIKKAGSKHAFCQVDYAYPLLVAQQCKNNGASLFTIVSAMGANSNSHFFYNKVKGDIENSLRQLNFEHLGIFRPSMLSGDRGEFRIKEYIGSLFMKAFAFLLPKNYRIIAANKVASAMIKYARSPNNKISIILSGQMQSH